ncbi:hypothetical protein, partial [Raoultella planticola]|uniref:hypothetical protein n=3 Tax=Raoultella planticola TaxID=575 RepID=UPI003524F054
INVVKTFVEVDKRLKKGVKSHRIQPSTLSRDAFLQGYFFIPPRETLWRSSASKSRGFSATLFWLSNAYVNIH